jgi:hypothetical protein
MYDVLLRLQQNPPVNEQRPAWRHVATSPRGNLTRYHGVFSFIVFLVHIASVE